MLLKDARVAWWKINQNKSRSISSTWGKKNVIGNYKARIQENSYSK